LSVELLCADKEGTGAETGQETNHRELAADTLPRSSKGPKGTIDTGRSHARGHQMVCDTSVRHSAETSYDQPLQVRKQSISGYGPVAEGLPTAEG
jgi:hypothetical protein